ncbi:MAG: chromate efflux transporter [Gemmatimonadales bacterium]
MSDAAPEVPFREAVRAWLRIAASSFGGPAGQIAVIHRVVVEERRWISEAHFVHALSYCMLLPGPEAQQLATYLGWRLHGTRGGLAAGLLFVAPGFLTILALSLLYHEFRSTGLFTALFFGLKPAVLPIVALAVPRLVRRTGGTALDWTLSALAFLAIFALRAPFPLILAAAALVGIVSRPRGAHSPTRRPPGPFPGAAIVRAAALWLAIWLVPVGLLIAVVGPGHVLAREAVFFGKAALVTFGGAYAVLGYVAQRAVESFGWLSPAEMLDGLGLAETTPGPLIMVVQFVGFLGAARNAGGLDPVVAGVIGSVVTAWVTFAPCFLFIFAGAPAIERLLDHPTLGAALRGVSAAVVGVVVNLALWFALHTFFGAVDTRTWGPFSLPLPDPSTLSFGSLMVALVASAILARTGRALAPALGGGALVGALLYLAGLR